MALFRNQADARREHFTDAGWYRIAWLGVYVVGVLLLLSRPARALARICAAAGPQERARCSSFWVSTAKSYRRQ